MADDNGDWFAATDDGPPPAKAADEENAAPTEEAPAGAEPASARAEAEAEADYLDPDKVLLFKHWIRPRFLPYRYLIEYRKNYYDDILDYMDKRNRGIPRDIPVAQTWAERALRTYNKYSHKLESYKLKLQDRSLVEETRPRYMQYKYLYDYRRSYYDDIIAAIESRKFGYRRIISRPQTWAQRVLRYYNDPIYKEEAFDRYLEDIRLVTRSEVSGRIYKSLSTQSFNKKYTTAFKFA